MRLVSWFFSFKQNTLVSTSDLRVMTCAFEPLFPDFCAGFIFRAYLFLYLSGPFLIFYRLGLGRVWKRLEDALKMFALLNWLINLSRYPLSVQSRMQWVAYLR